MKKAILFSLLALGAVTAQAQSKIGGLPPVNPGAVLELESTSKGFLPPRMTSAQRDAINSGTIATGLVIYNTDKNCLEFWGGSQWKDWCDNTVPSTVAVDTLDCATTNTGGSQPVSGQQTNGFSVFVPYSGGNGGAYASQVFPVAATSPVQELSAILLGGTTSSNGNLQFLISGSPSNSGQAVFPITFGGQSCSFTVDVLPGAAVASLTGCGTTLTPSNTITMGTAVPANTTVTMSYTGGNGGSFNTIAASSTNVIGMTATLTGAPINNGPGNLVWKISGTPSSGPASTAAFSFIFAGQSCSFSIPAAAGGAIPGNTTCTGKTISVTPCSSAPGAALNDNVATTEGTEYDWSGATGFVAGGTVQALAEIGGQCWFRRNVDNGTTGVYYTGGPYPNEGRIYTWGQVMNNATAERSQGVCPGGWHVPSDCEWMYLENTLGMTAAAQQQVSVLRGTDQGTRLKSGGTSGFQCLFAGYRAPDGVFNARNTGGFLWTSTAIGADVYYRNLSSFAPGVGRADNGQPSSFSVRCLKD